jgi:hypothetical protein
MALTPIGGVYAGIFKYPLLIDLFLSNQSCLDFRQKIEIPVGRLVEVVSKPHLRPMAALPRKAGFRSY